MPHLISLEVHNNPYEDEAEQGHRHHTSTAPSSPERRREPTVVVTPMQRDYHHPNAPRHLWAPTLHSPQRPLPPLHYEHPPPLLPPSVPTPFITDHGPQDILLGRGSHRMGHPGNVKYRNAIRRRQAEYQSCTSHHERLTIATEILDQVDADGGRFLHCHGENQYLEISRKQTMRKTLQALRERRKNHYRKEDVEQK